MHPMKLALQASVYLIANRFEQPFWCSDQVNFAVFRTSCPQAAVISVPSE